MPLLIYLLISVTTPFMFRSTSCVKPGLTRTCLSRWSRRLSLQSLKRPVVDIIACYEVDVEQNSAEARSAPAVTRRKEDCSCGYSSQRHWPNKVRPMSFLRDSGTVKTPQKRKGTKAKNTTSCGNAFVTNILLD